MSTITDPRIFAHQLALSAIMLRFMRAEMCLEQVRVYIRREIEALKAEGATADFIRSACVRVADAALLIALDATDKARALQFYDAVCADLDADGVGDATTEERVLALWLQCIASAGGAGYTTVPLFAIQNLIANTRESCRAVGWDAEYTAEYFKFLKIFLQETTTGFPLTKQMIDVLAIETEFPETEFNV